jgi:hypothetical protein
VSAEATLAVMEHGQDATSTPAEWQMLMLLANEANAQGVVVGVSMADLARRMGKSERGAAGVKGRLKAAGTLVVLEEGGGRGRQAVYWLKLPGLAGPETPQNPVETPQPGTPKNPETPQSAAPIPDDRSISSKTTTGSSSSKGGKEEAFLISLFGQPGGVAEDAVDRDTVADALALLGQGKKVGGKLVTPVEMAIAAGSIAAVNRCFEWKGKTGSDYGLGANLTSIVERARDRPSWDAANLVRLVESAWRVRGWERNGCGDRRPHPNVIWGGKSFDNVVQDAKDEAAGESPTKIRKRRYTRA